ncbi:DUF4021 domain-containing protein [Bacillus manliponensis]|uniref:DUF4021 domain-containing protein n=1 Tax=Bacillus manliponensis TaxID=574376 RepID=UPI0035177799
MRKEKKQKNNDIQREKTNSSIGLDPDEQAMNGLYGMPETEVENQARHHNTKN